ncbi:hypothetical protein [Campylobacter concisus]|uniref:hypothetical protein n=1 Tax=Campylobacter concisus TaxID=199 RepID=UPI00112FCBB5|nr:hypothetical protein [Campylobacter concisus]
MQEFSKKTPAKIKNLSVYRLFCMLKSEIKKLDLYSWCEVSRASTMFCVTHNNGKKFSQIFMNIGK